MTPFNLPTTRLLFRSLFLSAFALLQAAPAWARQNSSWPNLEEVIVVSKTHFDIGYTDLASRVVDRYRTSMADQALKLVDESRGLPPDQQFSWTLAGWPMAQILWPGQTPSAASGFLAAMRAGAAGAARPGVHHAHRIARPGGPHARAFAIPWRWRVWPGNRFRRPPR